MLPTAVSPLSESLAEAAPVVVVVVVAIAVIGITEKMTAIMTTIEITLNNLFMFISIPFLNPYLTDYNII